jgi:zinc protease
MKRLMLATSVLLAACGAGPRKPEELKYPELRYEVPDPASMRRQLGNGAALYALEDRSLPLVEIQVLVRGGSFAVPKGKEGLAGLCGTLMRIGGTASRAPAALDEQLDLLAAELSVSIGESTGAAGLSVLSKDLDQGLELLFDVLRRPAFNAEKLDLLKAQVMRQLRSRNDHPASVERREANLLLYGDYPANAHPTKASVESITREDCAAFHASMFRPANFVIAAAGDFSAGELEAKIAKLTEGWEGAAAPVAVPPVTHEAKAGVYCLNKKVNQGRVTIAHLGIGVDCPDVQALRVMSYILGAGGFSSRLMQRVRTEEGLAYDVDARFFPGVPYRGTFSMAFQSKNESCAYALKLCLEELERIRTQEPDAKEVEAAVNFYRDGFPGLYFATKFATVQRFATAEINNFPKDYWTGFLAKLSAVTPADVKRVAQEYCRPEKLVIVVVGDLDAIKAGDGKHPAKLSDFGPVTELALPDPMTLQRPGQ